MPVNPRVCARTHVRVLETGRGGGNVAGRKEMTIKDKFANFSWGLRITGYDCEMSW